MNDMCSVSGKDQCRQGGMSRYASGCLTGCFLAFLVIVVVPILCATIVTCKAVDAFKTADDGEDGRKTRRYEFVWRWGDGGEKYADVARIALKGAIFSAPESSTLFSTGDYAENGVLSRIRCATANDSILGIWLDVDSPGGEVTLSDDIRHALENFKASRKGRFVFARFGTMACSGGYYVSTAADYIMAEPTTITGSIGVLMSAVNAAGLAEKLGVKSVNIVSAENKAILDPMSPVRDEHVAILKKLVDGEYARFVSLVARARRLSEDDVRKIADGRVISADEALEAGLIDSIGYEDDAVETVEKMAKAADPESDGVRIYWMKGGSASGLLDMLSSIDASARAIGACGRCGLMSVSPAARLESRSMAD